MRITKLLAYGLIIYVACHQLSPYYAEYKPLATKILQDPPQESDPNAPPTLKASVNKANPNYMEKKIVTVINNILATERGQEMVQALAKTQAKSKVTIKRSGFHDITYFDEVIGSGQLAHCGQTVTFDDGVGGKKQTVKLGSGKLGRNFELALVGMKVSGKRDITFLENGRTLEEKHLAHLLQVTPEMDVDKLTWVDKVKSAGRIAYCGNKVTAHLIVSEENGKVLYSSKLSNLPLSFGLGDGNAPLVLEEILQEMREGGTRTAIVSTEVIKNVTSSKFDFLNKLVSLPMPLKLLFEVQLLKVE
jgi:hypothetical protein